MDEIIDINTLFGPLPAASTDLTVDALLELMRIHSVNGACALSTLGVLLDPHMGNSATRAACTDHPELIPVATLNPSMFFGDTTPVGRLVEEGFALVRFFPSIQGWPIDSVQFQGLIGALQTYGLPIMIGVSKPGHITVLSRSLGDYGLPVILSGVGAELLAEAVAALALTPHFHLETSNLLALGSIRMVCETVGVEKLLFGTGAPSKPIASALHTLQYAGLSEQAYRLAVSGNARRVLNLG